MNHAIALVSWNVLADAYIRPQYYPHVDPAWLAPGVRTQPIVAWLDGAGCDVACLQEVEPAVIAALRAAGWWVHYAQKRGKTDGCAIASRGVAVDSVRVVELVDGFVALLATARVGDGEVGIATTHLRWDRPETPQAERWAVRQSAEVLAALVDDSHPWLACGDLNVTPEDPVLALWRDAGFVDPAQDAPVPTACPNGRAKRIDHILVRGGRAELLPVVAVEDRTPLPSATMPSDHVPIRAKFHW